ncbi:MAG TPA: D-alanyl-D-alanine carboxypeptidase/D-alanyl-D-alanine-endopeptidase [Myxococcota bacterium]|nr:D-alanyl-D-alanine carboxypeptidase/D-alanyl-D-alanine-endopeptidase [Myxococcota bacterium]
MKKLLLVFVIFSLLGLTGCKSVNGSQSPKRQGLNIHEINRRIEDLIKKTDPNVNIGIKIVSVDKNQVIYQKNAERHFVPSSTIKIITLAAALHYLGPSYRFNTSVYTDRLIDQSGSVKNLYIKGSGDPSLMDHHLVDLVDELKQMGIKNVTGNIFVDDGIFDRLAWGLGHMWDDRHRGYSAPVSGLNLNYNRLLIKTVPSLSVADQAHSIVKPFTSFVDVIKKALTLKNGAKKSLEFAVEPGKQREDDWPSTTNDGLHFGDKVIVRGQTSKSAPAHYHSLAVNDPGILVGTFIKDQLHHHHIKMKGKVLRMAVPENTILLATHQSRSLAEALIDFTKISNNLAHDALIKVIAAEKGVKPATASAGFSLVNDFLVKEIGIPPNSIVTADGSGLSRYNLITPDQMVKTLLYASNNFALAPEFIASLPIGGEDGTLGRRLSGDYIRGRVRAKSGFMTGLLSLVGYLRAIDDELYAFAVMMNNVVGPTAKYIDFQEAILSTMLFDEQGWLSRGS